MSRQLLIAHLHVCSQFSITIAKDLPVTWLILNREARLNQEVNLGVLKPNWAHISDVELLCRAEGNYIHLYKLALHVMSAVWSLVDVQIMITEALRSRCAGCNWTWPIAKVWANTGEDLHWWRQSSLYLTNAFPRSLKRADHWKQRERWKTVKCMCHSATQACLYFIEGLYSSFVAQSFKALALLIMTSVQGRGYFQHTNTIIQTQPSNKCRTCVFIRGAKDKWKSVRCTRVWQR